MSPSEYTPKPPKDAAQPKDSSLSDSLDQIAQAQAKTEAEMREPSAERAVEILDSLIEKIDPEILALLCHPNIVLTLTGARAQTEDYILRPTEKNRAALEYAAELLQGFGITVIVDNETDTRGPDNAEILGFFMIDLSVLARASRSTTIPGILPYDASTGVEGMQAWAQDCVRSLDGQRRIGALDPRIGPEDYLHIVNGIAKGYPDKAILSYIIATQNGDRANSLVGSDIAHAREYECPEPNYHYGSEISDDADIAAHQKKWGELLAAFYDSQWHRDTLADPRYHAILSQRR